MKLRTILALAAGCCLMIGCDEEEDCSLNARPMMNCNIYALNEETGLYEQAAINQLTITAYGTDSIIVNQETNVNTLSLPLCYTADSTHLVLHYSNGEQDQVIVHHSNTPYFLSMECGYQMKQQIERVSHTHVMLDSIALTYNEAGIYGRENLKLYF